MANVPNAITLLRFALIPLLAWQLLQRDYATAFLLFIVSALSDLVDGLIARRWNLRTRFGAVADPLADKLTMLTAILILVLQDLLPWWFASAAVLRDIIIVGGATAYRLLIGPLKIAPTAISKLNTALEFLLLASLLAISAGHLDGGLWWRALLWATLVTIIVSGTHYVVVWGSRALQARRAGE
jgi:cardiolipin synthase (CMP-forming)